MFLLAVLLVAVVTVPAAGGRVSRLAGVTVRGVRFAFAALALQVLVVSVIPGAGGVVTATLHLASYAAAFWFLVLNRRLAGLGLVTAGATLNALVILLNGGVMPASASALRAAGLASSATFENSAVLAHPALPLLGDVFALPAWFPLPNVFSAGDVLIAAGAVTIVHVACGSLLLPFRLRAARRGPSTALPSP